MEGQVLNDTRHHFTTDARIVGGNKKSSYRTARVKGYSVSETYSKFREAETVHFRVLELHCQNAHLGL